MDIRSARRDPLLGLKKFILNGNVVGLAFGVVFGASFSAVINSAVKDLATPLMAATVGSPPDLSGLSFTVNGSKILYGGFVNAFLSFLIEILVGYFAVVAPVVSLMERMKKTIDPTNKQCPECLSEIPIEAKRCAHCGQSVG